MGLDSYYQTVVGDNPERLRAALDVAFSRADCVVTTGGLGPTKDDLTKEMLISYFGCTPTEDPEALRRLEERAARRVDGAQAHSALSSVSSGRLRSRTVMLSSDLARTHKQAAFRVEYFVKLPKH